MARHRDGIYRRLDIYVDIHDSGTLNGSGTAGLSCGTACGWALNIQVSPDRSIFNVVDVSPSSPGNYLQGVAIHQ
jgi:hypothetical protein